METSGLNLAVNGVNVSGSWSVVASTSLKEGKIALTGSPAKKWTINAGSGELNKEEIEDILILLRYTVSS